MAGADCVGLRRAPRARDTFNAGLASALRGRRRNARPRSSISGVFSTSTTCRSMRA
jgi:hypothetical protein